eukprot:3592908-Amphidinium_carterae.1
MDDPHSGQAAMDNFVAENPARKRFQRNKVLDVGRFRRYFSSESREGCRTGEVDMTEWQFSLWATQVKGLSKAGAVRWWAELLADKNTRRNYNGRWPDGLGGALQLSVTTHVERYRQEDRICGNEPELSSGSYKRLKDEEIKSLQAFTFVGHAQ